MGPQNFPLGVPKVQNVSNVNAIFFFYKYVSLGANVMVNAGDTSAKCQRSIALRWEHASILKWVFSSKLRSLAVPVRLQTLIP